MAALYMIGSDQAWVEFSDWGIQSWSFPYTVCVMSSKQTRRSISVSQDVYDRLKAWCDANGRSQSDVVEQETRKFLGMEPRTKVSVRLPQVSAKVPRVSAKVSTVSERLKETTPESTWTPAIELPAGVRNSGSRVETIKEVVESKKVEPPPGDKASKIFTF